MIHNLTLDFYQWMQAFLLISKWSVDSSNVGTFFICFYVGYIFINFLYDQRNNKKIYFLFIEYDIGIINVIRLMVVLFFLLFFYLDIIYLFLKINGCF